MNDLKKILIADDDQFIRELLVMTFADLADGIDLAANGLEALDKLFTERYALVLSDVRMPVMGGLTLLKEARSLVPRQDIILMSNDALDADVLRDLGAYAFLRKPFRLDTARQLVTGVLRGNAAPHTTTDGQH